MTANKFIPPGPLTTPVLFLIFNRLDVTKQVFQAIREAKPPRLYIAADGARSDRLDEDKVVNEVRNYVLNNIDWDCEFSTLFRDDNLGCKYAVSGAIDWFFENEEMGIILEDDCLPHPDFFHFCDNLLKKYAADERVLVITGNNFQDGQKRSPASYYFSKYNHCWGWATWRQAWALYDGDIPFWDEWAQSRDWVNKTPDPVERKYWKKIFNRVRADQIDSWDYPWTASVWHKGGLTATPNVNLVSNIGFGPDSTHTASRDSPLAAMATGVLGEITHPETISQDQSADRYAFDHTFGGKALRFPGSLVRFPRRAAGFLYRRLRRSFT